MRLSSPCTTYRVGRPFKLKVCPGSKPAGPLNHVPERPFVHSPSDRPLTTSGRSGRLDPAKRLLERQSDASHGSRRWRVTRTVRSLPLANAGTPHDDGICGIGRQDAHCAGSRIAVPAKLTRAWRSSLRPGSPCRRGRSARRPPSSWRRRRAFARPGQERQFRVTAPHEDAFAAGAFVGEPFEAAGAVSVSFGNGVATSGGQRMQETFRTYGFERRGLRGAAHAGASGALAGGRDRRRHRLRGGSRPETYASPRHAGDQVGHRMHDVGSRPTADHA